MTELNRLHQLRWKRAKALFESLKRAAEEQGAILMYDQTLIKPEQIVIGDATIHVQIENCSYRWFEANPEFDHGLYESVLSFRNSVKQRFKLVKEIEWI